MYYLIHFKMGIKMDITCRETVWGVNTKSNIKANFYKQKFDIKHELNVSFQF